MALSSRLGRSNKPATVFELDNWQVAILEKVECNLRAEGRSGVDRAAIAALFAARLRLDETEICRARFGYFLVCQTK